MPPLTGLEFLLDWFSTKIPRLRRWASALENFLPVVTQKLRVGFGKFVGQTNWLVLEWNEILFERDLWKETFQPLAQDNA